MNCKFIMLLLIAFGTTHAAPQPKIKATLKKDGLTEGIAILQHPKNRWYPSKWFTRDYGFFSPTPMYWLEGNSIDIPKGESLTLNYRVVVHTGDTNQAKIKSIFDAYEKAAKAR